MNEKETRSPLKSKPLRYAGQSLDEEIERVIDEDMMGYVWVSFLAVVFAAMEWLRWWLEPPPQPWLVSLLAIGALTYSFYRIRNSRRALETLKLGRDGERAVGEFLDILRADGHRVFHDVIGEGFNVDHVIISTRGIFAVETKTYRKPARGTPMVQVDGERVLVNGREPDRNPVRQAEALANWLHSTLEESTGKDFFVRSIVLFPGWFVKGKPTNKRVWVLNPKALRGWFANEPEKIAASDVNLAANHLSRYIRSR